jgi:hypothetical protein
MASLGLPIRYFAQQTAPNGQSIDEPVFGLVSAVDASGNPTECFFWYANPPYTFGGAITSRDDTLQTPKSWAPVSFTATIVME